MSETTGIEWCDWTFNPWIGCTKVGLGCDNCYAEVSTPARTLHINWGAKATRHRTSAGIWAQPVKWEREHEAFQAKHGRRRRVFCASLADVFDNEAPAAWRVELFRLIADTPHLDWLLLTKRIGNAAEMIAESVDSNDLPCWPWPNVWLGATMVNQPEYDRDIGKLLRTPAAVRFLSIEPMLGAIDMRMGGASMPTYSEHRPLPRLDWVIVGGESGQHARPMHPDWARSLRYQCDAAGVPFLFKQWGEWLPDNQNPAIKGPSGDTQAIRLGKKAAGRLLDGVEHNGYPA